MIAYLFFWEVLSAVLTHRQGRLQPRAPDFLGPQNVSSNYFFHKIIKFKNSISIVFWKKNMKFKQILFLGPLVNIEDFF